MKMIAHTDYTKIRFPYTIAALLLVLLTSTHVCSQNRTDVSLFVKKHPEKQLEEVHSESGDMYKILGHHGPAIENEYFGLRLYFNKKVAIDVYSKAKPGLELAEAKWYPTPDQQKQGWGADYYKVGKTVGLGGVRLWDGEKVVQLNPVSERSARVVKEGMSSYIEMLSKDVPYKGRQVDVLVKITVYSGIRKAKVEAIALTDDDVQFVTGINYHEGQKTIWEDNYLLAWGVHPEDVAAEKVAVGASIFFNPEDFVEKIDDGQQKLLISKPTKKLEYWISSANARETEINTFNRFKNLIEQGLPKKYTIDNCVNQYSVEISDSTKSGHRYWLVDKNFIDGRTLKVSAVLPNQATHPPHVHEMDEFFFILEGKAQFHLDGEERVVGKYTSLYCPANVPHGISNAGETELKYLVIKKYPRE
jgi:mannose-6-phosphate isomerase-like protein (cupin superfamily)